MKTTINISGEDTLSNLKDNEPYTNLEIHQLYYATDIKKLYRINELGFLVLESNLELGETNLEAYRGDRGKIAYDHSELINNPHNITKDQIDLSNVDNTSDATKNAAVATLINKTLVTPTISPIGFTNSQHTHSSALSGGVIPIVNTVGTLPVSRGGTTRTSFTANSIITGGITTISTLQSIPNGTANQFLKSNGSNVPSFQTAVKADIGLWNVDNTPDTGKPVSFAQQDALNLKADLNSPTFTGAVSLPNNTITNAMIAGTGTRNNTTVYKGDGTFGAPSGDNLGNHIATQNLIVGFNSIKHDASTNEALLINSLFVGFAGNFGGAFVNWSFNDHLSMPSVPNATNFDSNETGMKVFCKMREPVSGVDQNRLYIHTEEDRPTSQGGGAQITGPSKTYKIVTEQDFIYRSNMRTFDILRTSGSFDTELRTNIPFAGTYKVHLHLVFRATVAGGGVGWAIIASNLVNANSYFTRQDQFAITSDWTTLNYLNAPENVINTNVALDYTGVMEFSAPTTVNITTGTNGVGNTTYAKGCYITFTKIN